MMAGEIAVGKTTVAQLLAAHGDRHLVRVRTALEEVLRLRNPDRLTLQREGADLDRRTNGEWLLDYLLARFEVGTALVVDSFRTERQASPVLRQLPGATLVYLRAAELTRRSRYERAAFSDPVKRSVSFDVAVQDPIELEVIRLETWASVVVDTDKQTVGEVVQEVESALPQPQ